jgi:hypothetical protein
MGLSCGPVRKGYVASCALVALSLGNRGLVNNFDV